MPELKLGPTYPPKLKLGPTYRARSLAAYASRTNNRPGKPPGRGRNRNQTCVPSKHAPSAFARCASARQPSLGLPSRSSRFGVSEGWSGKRDSNPRLRPWQGRTLPLSYSRPCSSAEPPIYYSLPSPCKEPGLAIDLGGQGRERRNRQRREARAELGPTSSGCISSADRHPIQRLP
jgi:hypothetical protein